MVSCFHITLRGVRFSGFEGPELVVALGEAMKRTWGRRLPLAPHTVVFTAVVRGLEVLQREYLVEGAQDANAAS